MLDLAKHQYLAQGHRQVLQKQQGFIWAETFSSGPSTNSNVRSTTTERSTTSPNVKKSARATPTKSNIPVGSTSKSSGIQCFKCSGQGYVMKECANNRQLISDPGQGKQQVDEGNN